MLPEVQALQNTVRSARQEIARLDALAGFSAPVPAVRRRPIVVDWKEAP
jgi:hypothetical protein